MGIIGYYLRQAYQELGEPLSNELRLNDSILDDICQIVRKIGVDISFIFVENLVQEQVEEIVSPLSIYLLQVSQRLEEVLIDLGGLLFLGFLLSALSVLHVAREGLNYDLIDLGWLDVDGWGCGLGGLRLPDLGRLLLFGLLTCPRLDLIVPFVGCT